MRLDGDYVWMARPGRAWHLYRKGSSGVECGAHFSIPTKLQKVAARELTDPPPGCCKRCVASLAKLAGALLNATIDAARQ
jgi:hypothetical protein